MAETIDLDSDGKPTGETSKPRPFTFGSDEPVGAWARPVAFNAATTFQSPFFWIVVGAGVALAACYFIKRKGIFD